MPRGAYKRKVSSVQDRFWKHVEKSDGCWIWQASLDSHGYGQINNGNGKPVGAHRVSYEIKNGKINRGMVIDHLCRNPTCVNPSHMEVVTRGENVIRGRNWQREKTHCKRGHKFNEMNTKYSPQGYRKCWECIREKRGYVKRYN